MTRRYEGIYALGVGLLAFGLADVTIGNGLIAAFVCGIALAVAEHDIADDFVDFSENVSSILQVLAFFVFGALIVAIGYGGSVALLLRLRRLRPAGGAAAGGAALLPAGEAARRAPRLHRLVRAQGGRLDAVRPVRPQLGRAASAS